MDRSRLLDGLPGCLPQGGDAACLTTAAGNFDFKFVCTEAELDCRTALKFCIANCPNL